MEDERLHTDPVPVSGRAVGREVDGRRSGLPLRPHHDGPTQTQGTQVLLQRARATRGMLNLPMPKLLSSKAQGCKAFCKPEKTLNPSCWYSLDSSH